MSQKLSDFSERPLSSPLFKNELVNYVLAGGDQKMIKSVKSVIKWPSEKAPSLFGIELAEMWRRQAEKFPDDGSLKDKPWVLKVLATKIVSLNGEETIGIFRISGESGDVLRCLKALDNWKPDKAAMTSKAYFHAEHFRRWS